MCNIISIFVLFVAICKTSPQLTQLQLGVTRNLKSTYMYASWFLMHGVSAAEYSAPKRAKKYFFG